MIPAGVRVSQRLDETQRLREVTRRALVLARSLISAQGEARLPVVGSGGKVALQLGAGRSPGFVLLVGDEGEAALGPASHRAPPRPRPRRPRRARARSPVSRASSAMRWSRAADGAAGAPAQRLGEALAVPVPARASDIGAEGGIRAGLASIVGGDEGSAGAPLGQDLGHLPLSAPSALARPILEPGESAGRRARPRVEEIPTLSPSGPSSRRGCERRLGLLLCRWVSTRRCAISRRCAAGVPGRSARATRAARSSFCRPSLPNASS